ncbi:hypothetical protein, partial [Wolbachia endosymbiont of Drosophila auraria]|uniref:hypothetical protein n=1 Tax=Wolbachia endosymbiont of Drosophila auraria TaxID=553632 RepID=UPI00397B93B3
MSSQCLDYLDPEKRMVSFQYLTMESSFLVILSKMFARLQLKFLDPSGLCCIASYDGLKIKKVENISSLL